MDELNTPNVKIIENATRDDGRPGDHLTWEEVTTKGGVTRAVRHEGIAHHRDGDGDWCTEDGTWITLSDSDEAGVTITIRRTVRELPTKRETVIVPNDGYEAIEAGWDGRVWRANEAVLGTDGHWHGVWRRDDGRGVAGCINRQLISAPTWKVAGQ